jgi:hypothetical protein
VTSTVLLNESCSNLYTASEFDLNALEDQSDELCRAHKATAPLGVVGRSRLRGNNFLERFALFFESRHFVTNTNQQVAVEGQLRLVANGTVTWNDDHPVRDFGQISFRSANRAVNTATC